ncbi:hypothetical protein Vafri_8378 [Volvox africanus]|nr:hypothetical protein Vafri_8378 [Volvox africanus]
MNQSWVMQNAALRPCVPDSQRRCLTSIANKRRVGVKCFHFTELCFGAQNQPVWGQRYKRTLRAAETMQAVSSTPEHVDIAKGVSVAVIGVGLMGNKIARRLASQNANVLAWNRSAEKVAALPEASISVCSTVADAATAADVLLLTLSDAATIRETILSDGVRHLLAGKIVLQMGTIGPKESSALAADVVSAGGRYIEAPVLGSQPEAEKGTLLIMVGADTDPRDDLDGPVWPLLRALGQEQNIHYIGPVGTAAAVKLALNQLIASLTIGFSTSLGLVQRSGAPVEKFMSILRASALYAPTYDKKLQKMLDRDYGAANFPTKVGKRTWGHIRRLALTRLHEALSASASPGSRRQQFPTGRCLSD